MMREQGLDRGKIKKLRPDGDQRQLPRVLPGQPDDLLRRGSVVRAALRSGPVRVAEPIRAVPGGCVVHRLSHRADRTHCDRDAGEAGQLEHPQRVQRSDIRRHVSVHGADRDQFGGTGLQAKQENVKREMITAILLTPLRRRRYTGGDVSQPES